jgi:hypothetical protein
MKTRINTIPYANEAYLPVDPNLLPQWKNYLSRDRNFKIGICWNGNSQYRTAGLRKAVAQKAIPLTLLAELSQIPGVTLYSLQRTDGNRQEENLPSSLAVTLLPFDFDITHGRFMDTAAIMKNLDLVITVDTAILHLAGGLGVRTWGLLPYSSDWRWLIDRSDTPWYSSVTLFRQKSAGNWEDVMLRVKTELISLVDAHRASTNPVVMHNEKQGPPTTNPPILTPIIKKRTTPTAQFELAIRYRVEEEMKKHKEERTKNNNQTT